ncbi:MAG TPA: SRPBCC family protein [Dehalococcoidia bacterium]|nr:SRPBCC family protein [Dehalococcoidia bacterium]
MAAYYTSQAYDAPASLIWSILTDFPSWPHWFPNVRQIDIEGDGAPQRGTTLLASGMDPEVWTRWAIVDWAAPLRLVCEHVESNARLAPGVSAARLQFELADEAEGCTLEVEIGADGFGMVGDFFVSMSLGQGARRLLPQLIDAFTAHVLERVASGK